MVTKEDSKLDYYSSQELLEQLFERYHNSKNRKDRKEIKERYNSIANRINTEVGRNIILIIH